MLLKFFLNEYLKIDPLYAVSILDINTNNNIYTNYLSNEYLSKYKKILIKYKKKTYNKKNLNDKLLYTICKNQLKLHKTKYYLFPLNSCDNLIIDFKEINEVYYKINNLNDYNSLINRIKSFQIIIDTLKIRLLQGINKNLTISKFICNKIIKDLEYFINNKLYIINIDKKFYKYDYINIINKYYRDNIIKFIKFLKNTYLNKCKNSISMSKLPNGKHIYKSFILSNLSLNIKPKNIFKIGIDEVNRLQNEFRKNMNNTTNYNNLIEYFNYMLNNKKFKYENNTQMYNHYIYMQKFINKNIINKFFYKKVKDYKIKFIDKELEDMRPAAYYYPVSKKDFGIIYINEKLNKHKYNAFVLSLHEGIPGHHYQYKYMTDNNIPLSKIYTTFDTAYVEGWALYCESLGNEFYNNEEYFGKLSFEILRASRLVVDVGINYYNWSYKKAYNYMKNNIPLDDDNIKNELERYICSPGQALSYKIGELKIIEIRDKFINNKHGNIKDFHKKILDSGVITLNLLEDFIIN